MLGNVNAKDMILMFGDIPVLRINFDYGIYDIINEKYVPYGLRGNILKSEDLDENASTFDRIQSRRAWHHNYHTISHWLADRIIPLNRENARWIYNALNIPQRSSYVIGLKIAALCRDASVLDKYWLKLDGDGVSWQDVDIKRNPLNESIAQIALHGSAVAIGGSLITPELTTGGIHAKAWRRHADGNLWLHKVGHNGDPKVRMEVVISNILDKCNVDHVHYESGQDNGRYVCMCPCITTDDISVVSAYEFSFYCSANSLDMYKEIVRIDSDNYYKMHIVDYLISNRNRHLHNWGFYMDNSTMEIIGMHPLFSHSNAFAEEWINDKSVGYLFHNRPIDIAAKYAMSKVDFHFTDNITRKDFLSDRQYESFMDRATELGVKTT